MCHFLVVSIRFDRVKFDGKKNNSTNKQDAGENNNQMPTDFEKNRARKMSMLRQNTPLKPEAFLAIAAKGGAGRRKSVLPSDLAPRPKHSEINDKSNFDSISSQLLVLHSREKDVYTEDEPAPRKFFPVPNTLKEAEMQVEGAILRHKQNIMEKHPKNILEEGETLISFCNGSRLNKKSKHTSP